jgi:hypothetical protein
MEDAAPPAIRQGGDCPSARFIPGRVAVHDEVLTLNVAEASKLIEPTLKGLVTCDKQHLPKRGSVASGHSRPTRAFRVTSGLAPIATEEPTFRIGSLEPVQTSARPNPRCILPPDSEHGQLDHEQHGASVTRSTQKFVTASEVF